MPRQLIYYPEPVLRKPAERVKKVSADVKALIQDMLEAMGSHNGLGLAAPQVGVPLQVFVADPGDGPLAVVNARIVRAEGEQVGLEGCLCFPRLYGNVARAKAITVQGLDADGKKTILRAEDLLARVIQHEIDHLNGVLFIDKVDPATVHWLLGYEAETAEPIRQPTSLEDALRALAARGPGPGFRLDAPVRPAAQAGTPSPTRAVSSLAEPGSGKAGTRKGLSRARSRD